MRARAGMAYEGRITRYNWTGSMASVFLNSGLFEKNPMSFNAKPGDIYLDENSHTAMCIQNDGSADLLGECSISETGGIDGKPGDQTGRESSVHAYYSGKWDFILHYNGKADSGGGSGTPSGSASAPTASGDKANLPMPRYRAAIMRNGQKVWLDWCEGIYCTDGCGDMFAGIEGMGIADV